MHRNDSFWNFHDMRFEYKIENVLWEELNILDTFDEYHNRGHFLEIPGFQHGHA